jgi:hypothetical protein
MFEHLSMFLTSIDWDIFHFIEQSINITSKQKIHEDEEFSFLST